MYAIPYSYVYDSIMSPSLSLNHLLYIGQAPYDKDTVKGHGGKHIILAACHGH